MGAFLENVETICATRRTVAVDENTLGTMRFPPSVRAHSSSIAVSYSPTIVPVHDPAFEARVSGQWHALVARGLFRSYALSAGR